MAVGTGTVDIPHRVRPSHHDLMALLSVAALTNLGTPKREQPLVIRSVRRVAGEAVLPNGRMLPQKWASFFLMAGITHFIDGIRVDQLLRRRSMRIVASGALHPRSPALITKQVRGAAHGRVPLARMTGAAGLRLRRPCHGLAVAFLMDTVAAQAPHTGRFVRAAAPKHPLLVREMAGETGCGHRLWLFLDLIADEPRIAGVDVPLQIAGMAGCARQFLRTETELHGLAVRGGAKLTRERLVTIDTGPERVPARLMIRPETNHTSSEQQQDRTVLKHPPSAFPLSALWQAGRFDAARLTLLEFDGPSCGRLAGPQE